MFTKVTANGRRRNTEKNEVENILKYMATRQKFT